MQNKNPSKYENLADDLSDAWEGWLDHEEGTNEYEDRARRKIMKLVAEMYEEFESTGALDET